MNTLSAGEHLGVDNIIFISILSGKLPEHQRATARQIGIALAAVSRLALLFPIAWIVGLTQTVVTIFGNELSWRDFILIGGGLFLIYKAVNELHGKLEGPENAKGAAVQATFAAVILQIMVLDMVFALDSIITAVGMTSHVSIMVVAILVADGFGEPVPKGFVYSSMAFATLVELLNIGVRRAAAKPVELHQPYTDDGAR